MVALKLYTFIGFASGLILINYGFNIIAAGLSGTRALTSQFLGLNLLVGGSVVVFFSLYFLLRPVGAVRPTGTQPAGSAPDVGVELIVEETPPSQYGFYKNIEYIGYFFTALGLFSAADLVLQVFIPELYNEGRWWVEVLLVTFGVLAYAIFGSIGRLGAEEEKQYSPTPEPGIPTAVEPAAGSTAASKSYPETLEVRVDEFSKLSSGEYERHVAGAVYDMFRVEREGITIWRENRLGMRSVYLAGPYELSKKLIEDQMNRGQALKIGYLSLSVESMQSLLSLQEHPVEGVRSTVN